MSRREQQVIELRQYTLHPGRRDELITLFEREFIEPQEALGLHVIGQFRDLDDPDRFVWLRGFDDMASRRPALASFYGGPVWRAHGHAANATMVDSDNVLLLRPAWAGAGLVARQRREPGTVAARPAGYIDAAVFHLHEAAPPELLGLCRDVMLPTLQRGGAQAQGWYVSEPAPNDFPRLPVREGERALVGFAVFAEAATHEAFVRSGAWARDVEPSLAAWVARPAECLRLAPTARSAIHA